MTPEPAVLPLSMETVESTRENLGLTIRDFCLLLGFSRQTYYTWLKRGVVADASRKKARNRLGSMVRIAGEYDLPRNSKERAAIMAGVMAA